MINVSVITITCNRRRFIPRLIEMYKAQLYPLDQMEWIIVDDGDNDQKVADLFMYSDLPNIVYLPLAERQLMGAKLNIAKGRATGEIIVVMDDDDYYPPERVLIAVRAFEENPDILVAGCSKTFMYYTDTDEVFCAGPYNDNHALNCTIAFRLSYTGKYDDNEPCAVERAFLNDFTEEMVQLYSKNTILHIIHSTNTFNAIRGRDQGTLGLLKKTQLKLENFIHDEEMRRAFMGKY